MAAGTRTGRTPTNVGAGAPVPLKAKAPPLPGRKHRDTKNVGEAGYRGKAGGWGRANYWQAWGAPFGTGKRAMPTLITSWSSAGSCSSALVWAGGGAASVQIP
jgi:hypothetical protein